MTLQADGLRRRPRERLTRLVRTMLSRPIGWAYALLLAIGIAIPILLLLVASSMNREAREGSEDVAATAIRALAEADSHTVNDYTEWNLGHGLLAGTVDRDFADQNIGPYLGRNFGLSGSVLVADDDRITYQWLELTSLRDLDDKARVALLAKLLQSVRADPVGAARHGYVVHAGDVFLTTAARIRREQETASEAGPVLIVLRALNGPLLSRLAANYALDQLRVVDPKEPVHGNEASIVLSDVEGKPVAIIAWRGDWPGTRMAWSFGVPVVVLLLVLVILALFSLARIQRYSREIATTNLSLSEREAEALAARARAETADHAKTSFLTNMSHELRTPLNAVIGFCELLETELYGPLNQKQAEYLRDIKTSGHHLLGIINDILDTARLGAGQHKLNPERLTLATVVDDSLRFVRGRAEEGGIALQNEVARDMPALFADARSVRQVLINLAGNAVKFTPQGGTVAVKAWIADNGDCIIAIIDDGTGIPRETLARLFQPFQQGDNTLTRRHEGTGLGLAISRELMALHGGSLTIESEVGKGTQAMARFPAERVVYLTKRADDLPSGSSPPDPPAPGTSPIGTGADSIRRTG